jgi:hypothetical protein
MSLTKPTCRIKIVHLVTSLEVGGAQHNMLLGLPRLDPERYEHTIVSIMDRMQMERQFRDAGIDVHSLRLNRKTDLTVALRLRTLLKQIRPDILHTYLIHGNVLGRIVGRLVGVPTIIGSELTIGQAGRVGRLVTKLTNPLTDAVEVNSNTGGRAAAADLGVPTGKIEVVLPGLDLSAFGGTDSRSTWDGSVRSKASNTASMPSHRPYPAIQTCTWRLPVRANNATISKTFQKTSA